MASRSNCAFVKGIGCRRRCSVYGGVPGRFDAVALTQFAFDPEAFQVGRIGLITQRLDAARSGFQPDQAFEVLIARHPESPPVARFGHIDHGACHRGAVGFGGQAEGGFGERDARGVAAKAVFGQANAQVAQGDGRAFDQVTIEQGGFKPGHQCVAIGLGVDPGNGLRIGGFGYLR